MENVVDIQGVRYHTGWLPTPLSVLARMHEEGTLAFDPQYPIAPPAEEQEVDCSIFWHDRKSQCRTNMCTAVSGAQALSICLKKQGFDVKISAAAVYAPICSGRDSGASIGECLEALKKYGAWPKDYKGISDTDWQAAYRTQFWRNPESEHAKEAAKYRITEAVFCGSNIDKFVEGIKSGHWCGQFGVGADSSFYVQKDGWLPRSYGTGVNHAQTATGGTKKHPDTGKLGLQGANTWGESWGLSGLYYFDPYSWLSARSQELWLVRATVLPI